MKPAVSGEEPSVASAQNFVGPSPSIVLPSSNSRPLNRSVDVDAEGDQDESSFIPDTDWRNFR